MELSRNMPERLMCAPRLAKAHHFTSSSRRSGKQSMSKGSILVVDDESEIREGLELLLKGEGYGVSSAETGESGLAKLEEHPFDLLLLDVSLLSSSLPPTVRSIWPAPPSKMVQWTTSPSRGPTMNCSRKWPRPWNLDGFAMKTSS